MSFSTYADLKTGIAAWLRPNSAVTSDMTTNIPKYVKLAEVMINRELHLRALDQAETDLYILDGTADAPTGFLSVISLSLTAAPYSKIEATALDTLMSLDQAQTGDPLRYAHSGTTLYFWPPTNSTARLFYRRGATALSADTDYNWILTEHPDAYLAGALVVAARRLIDPRLGQFEQWFAESLDSIKRLELNLHTDMIRPQPSSGFIV